MDELGFYVPSTVFQSFRDDGRVNMKGSVQWSAVQVREESRLQRDSNPRPRDPKSGALTARPRGRFWNGNDQEPIEVHILSKLLRHQTQTLRTIIETSHEIMVLFVLRKFILQTRMRSHPVGLDVWFSVGFFAYFHTSCVRTANALAGLRGCAGLSEPSLVYCVCVISTIISWAGSYHV